MAVVQWIRGINQIADASGKAVWIVEPQSAVETRGSADLLTDTLERSRLQFLVNCSD